MTSNYHNTIDYLKCLIFGHRAREAESSEEFMVCERCGEVLLLCDSCIAKRQREGKDS